MFQAIQIGTEIFSGVPGADDPVILFRNRETAAVAAGDGLRLPVLAEASVAGLSWLCPGTIDGRRCYAAALPPDVPWPETAEAVPGRRMLAELADAERNAFCRGRELVTWAASHRFCGACRAELTASGRDMALICPACGRHYYPQLAPAVIVAVTRNGGRELLLAHNRAFEPEVFSLIAGFVEAGESVEAAVHREIFEECGITVRGLRYLTSQVWPFPNSLMLAFTAEYDSGTAVPDGTELSEVGWFTAGDLPRLPGAGSVARRVIEGIFGAQIK